MNTTINVNVDKELKEKSVAILKGLGLNMSTAINMFLAQVVKRNGIPFEVTNPRYEKELIEAIKELEETTKNPQKYPGYDNWEDLKKALLSDD